MDQSIRFTRSIDKVRLAYAMSGNGPPLVKAPNWLSHLEFDWQSPLWRHWFGFFTRISRLIRFDARGCGLSDWDATDLSFEAQVADLEAVVDAAGADRFDLLGISQGGSIAVEYAIRHPERVAHLVLYGAFARGWDRRDEQTRQQFRALTDLMRIGWGQENPAFRRLFTTIFVPDASPAQEAWFTDLMRITSPPEIAARVFAAAGQVDVMERLAQVRVPTLVIHARGDACIPYEEGRAFAAGIPGAQFVTLESRNHILLESEPAWARFQDVFSDFVGRNAAAAATGEAMQRRPDPRFEQLTARERDLLCLVARGLSNADIARRVCISEKTVRNHLTNVFSKLNVNSRAKAIVLAREAGLVE